MPDIAKRRQWSTISMAPARKTYEAWRADLLAFSGATPLLFTELELRRFHGQGCDAQMIRALCPDMADRGRSIREVEILHSELATVRAYREERSTHF